MGRPPGDKPTMILGHNHPSGAAGASTEKEITLDLDDFPSPSGLWER